MAGNPETIHDQRSRKFGSFIQVLADLNGIAARSNSSDFGGTYGQQSPAVGIAFSRST
jgi:hypothetical protein